MNISAFKDAHKGESAYIIGCGATINQLTREDFDNRLTLTINHSVEIIRNLALPNQILGMQKDGFCLDPVPPEALLVHELEESNELFMDYSPRYVFNNNKLGLAWDNPSVCSAYAVLEYLGISSIDIYGVDTAFKSAVRFDGREFPQYNLSLVFLKNLIRLKPISQVRFRLPQSVSDKYIDGFAQNKYVSCSERLRLSKENK